MSSGRAETVQARSLSCGDVYMLLSEEDQDLIKDSTVVCNGMDSKVRKDSRKEALKSHRAPRSTTAISTKHPLMPSELSLPRPVDGGWGWVVVFGAFFVHLIIDGLCCSFGVLFVELYDYFDCSRSKLSLTGAFLYAMPMLFAPVSSALIDVYGCRVVGFSGGVLSASGAIACAFTTSLDCLIVLFGLLIGIGMSLTMTCSFVIIVVFFERRRTLALGLAISGIGFGSIIVPPLLELLIDIYTWRGAIFILSALLLQSGAFCLLFRPLESPVEQRQRLYLRTLENFSRIVGYGEFLLGTEYLKSSLNKQITMLRTYVSSHVTRSRCPTSQAVGNSTVETLAWPSGLDDSLSSSSSSSSSSSHNLNVVVTTLPSTKDKLHQQHLFQQQHQHHLQQQPEKQPIVKQNESFQNESCPPLGNIVQVDSIAPKAEPELDLEDEEDESDRSDDDCDDPLLKPDALVDCLREIEMHDNMPDPESYRILLPDQLLDTIPENAELDLTTRVMNRSLGSITSSSSSLQMSNGLAYDTYLDLSNPQLDDDDEEDLNRMCGRLSYKSLPSDRSNSGRLTSIAGSVTSQSLDNLVHSKSFGSMVEVFDKETAKLTLCRTSSDPELLRRRQCNVDRPLQLDSTTEKISAKVINDDESWQPLLMSISPKRHRSVGNKLGFSSCEADFATVKHQESGDGSMGKSAECVPFESIGRLNLALSMPRLQAYSDLSISTGHRRGCQGEFDFRSRDLLASFSQCCRDDSSCSLYSYDRVLSNVSYLCLFISNILVFCFYNMTMFYIGQYSMTLGANSQEMAILFASLGVANFFGQIGVGVIGNMQSVDIVLFFAITQGLMGVSTLIVPLLPSYWSLLIHTVSFGLAISGNDALSAALSVHFVGLEDANIGISFNLFGQGIANFVGPPIIGAIIEMTDSYTPAFLVSGACLLLSGFIMIPAIVLNRRRRNKLHCRATKRRCNEKHSSSCEHHMSSDVELV